MTDDILPGNMDSIFDHFGMTRVDTSSPLLLRADATNPLLSTSVHKPDLLDVLTTDDRLDINFDLSSALVGQVVCSEVCK